MLNVRDAALAKSIALPAAAGSVHSAALDLEGGQYDIVVGNMEVSIEAPALTTAQLPDGCTAAYVLEASETPGFEDPGSMPLFSQEGEGGEGAAARAFSFRLPADCGRYLRLTITTADAVDETPVGDCSAASAPFGLRF